MTVAKPSEPGPMRLAIGRCRRTDYCPPQQPRNGESASQGGSRLRIISLIPPGRPRVAGAMMSGGRDPLVSGRSRGERSTVAVGV
jgi:hypothetical protein